MVLKLRKNNTHFFLKNLPVSLFSMIMGITGFAIAFLQLEQLYSFLPSIGNYFVFFSTFLFISVIFLYFFKVLMYPSRVKDEFSHPLKMSFFSTISISILLQSIAYLEINTFLSSSFWIIGTIFHFIFTIKLISIWIEREGFEVTHMNPSWFLLAQGNILVPIAGIYHFIEQISWFFLSIGLILWFVFLVIFFNRIIFYNPLPSNLLPTLFILIAPPSFAFISLNHISSGVLFEISLIFYYFALFMLILLFFQYKFFIKLGFDVSWWAYSFPLAAITNATILMYSQTNLEFFGVLSLILLFILSLIISLLLILTLKLILKKELLSNF